jgi:helix-turn-helix protein
VPRKFSLKDNPIFQRLEAPEPREVEPPVDEALPSEEFSRPSDRQERSPGGHKMTVSDRPSESNPQNLTLNRSSAQQTRVPAQSPQAQSPQPSQLPRDLRLKDHLDKSLFFSFFNEMVDDLLPMLDPNEQVLYIRLFRLSYGFNRNYCTVSQSLLIERTGFSRNTIRTSLQSLVQKGWISIAEAGNRVSTTYQVVLPREKRTESRGGRSNFDPQDLTLRNRPSQSDAHIASRESRGSESNPREGQNLALQDLTLKNRPEDTSMRTITYDRGPNVEGQELPPLLKAFTNSSLTLLTGESRSTSEGQNLTLNSLLLLARELVDKFYSSLGQRPSKTKRQKSTEECLNLLLEGFTVEEVDYAISWLIRYHPTTGAFSRLVHFIDQAVKERQTEQQAREVDQAQARAAEHRHAEQQRMEEERRQIEEVKTSLPAEMLEGLYQEAKQLIEQESPHLKFGKDLMIQVKLNELVKLRYLP